MNLLRNLSASYKQSLLMGNVEAVNGAGEDGNRPVPPYTEMMGTLQTLRQNDPILYQRVKREVVLSLQAANPAGHDAPDIRDLVQLRRRRTRGQSIMNRLNHIAYFLFPASAQR
jgi:hypothetical protein